MAHLHNRIAGNLHDRIAGRVRWLRESANGRIFAAAVMIAGLASLVKVASIAKEMLIARRYGTGAALDAFYVAFLLPSFFSGIIASSCNGAFIPTYLEVRASEGSQAAHRLFSSAAFFNVVMLIGVSLTLAIAQGRLLPLIGSSFGPNELALARLLLLISFGSLLFTGLSSLWRAVLNAHESFALPALSPMMNPVLITILLLARQSIWGVYALAAGIVLGAAAELVVLGCGLRRLGLPIIPRWYGLDGPIRQVLAQTAPLIVGSVLLGSSTLVDQSMAAMLGSGSVSALNYANKVIPMLLNIGTSSLSMAVLPRLSSLSANRDWAGMRQLLSAYTRVTIIVTVPLMTILILYSEPVVTLFFQGGAFTRQDTQLVARVQSLLCLEVPFYAVAMLFVNAISALKRNHILMLGTTISVTMNIALNYLLMKTLGLPGIALSTAGVYATACFYLYVMLYRALEERERETALVPSYAAISAD
jgi:putative peptidoglycan lipid II flippase